MPGKVVSLDARRDEQRRHLALIAARSEATDPPEVVPCAVQASPGEVALVTPDGVLAFPADQAFELAKDIWNCAREAKEAERRG